MTQSRSTTLATLSKARVNLHWEHFLVKFLFKVIAHERQRSICPL